MYYFLLKFLFFVHTRILAELSPTSLIFLLRHLLSESGRFYNSEWQRESSVKMRVWGTKEEPLVNNLVYTKRQMDIYANRKHETTKGCFKW